MLRAFATGSRVLPAVVWLCAGCSAGEGAAAATTEQGGSMSFATGGSAGASASGSAGLAGKASGGANPSGGSPATGGASGGTGGALLSGGTSGASTGGAPTGGVSTGTGGAPSGGVSSGGSPGGAGAGGGGKLGMQGGAAGSTQGGAGGTGNAGGGGAESGGQGGSSTPGLGAWTDGYVATMYGDIDSGDCVAYAGNFSDQTPISTYTCVLGNGPRKVTLSSYDPNDANNANYYAALGDLSSLWSANGNAGPCTCNGSTTATCGGPQCPAEISETGACGICIAVKCDPDSAFEDDNGYSHNAYCNDTTYVVVQNIDACPHNHTTNVASGAGWCTERQAQHIDLSCSGLGDISTLGTNVGQQGWLPVSVQVVDCDVGLGPHEL